MAYRELELTLLSAQELKNVNLITRMDVYAVVSISNDPLTRQCTEPDTYGGRNPRWNAAFRFAVPPTAAAAAGASLHVLLRAERFLGDRDVGEVVVPLSDILASATGAGPQPPQVVSYQVRKLHRWEPRGVLNVSYRLGPVVAPVVERTPSEKVVYAPVAVRPPQPSHQNPPAKPDAYRPPPSPSPSPSPPPPRPAAVHAARHEEARAPSPTPPAPAPTPPPANGGSNNGHGQPGPTHFYMGPIIFGGAHSAASSGPPTRTTSPARSIISPASKGDGNWALPTQGNYTSAAESMSVSVISPRSRKEDRWRPSLLSQSQHGDTQQQQAASSPVAAASPHRLAAAASPFSSRSSSFSSPLSPYSSAHPSPSSSSAHSTRSSYSAATSPHPSLRSPAISDAAEVTHEIYNSFRSTSSRGAAISSPLPSSSPMVPNHSRGGAVSSPLHSSSPRAPKHSSVVPSL